MKIELRCTGDLRDVANSAWVSTISEAQSKKKTDDEVLTLSNYLVEHHHTTPFESITLTFSAIPSSEMDLDCIKIFEESKWCRLYYDNKVVHITTDLFNFVKIMMRSVNLDNLESHPFWASLHNKNPRMAEVVKKFSRPKDYVESGIRYLDIMGEEAVRSIGVELVSYHAGPSKNSSRATWRVSCPLSVAVQLLRHRSASFNMTSARYRTLNQDIVMPFDDIMGIAEKAGEGVMSLMLESFEMAKSTSNVYKKNMDLVKVSKNKKLITNDEYKRLREFLRYVLPEGRITELYVSFYMDDFENYLSLRESPHAQLEHGYLAKLMHDSANAHLKSINK
jgi:thymidylate synthase ThyX